MRIAHRSVSRLASSVLVASLALASALPAFAGIPPLDFSKAFVPDTIGPGSTTALTFSIENTTAAPVADIAFTDVLPAGVSFADPPSAFTDCVDGAVTISGAPDTLDLSGARLSAGGVCTVTVEVTSGTPGSYFNVSGILTSSAGSSGTAAATLDVVTGRPGFSKSFVPSSIPLGGISTLTFMIDNTASAANRTALRFEDFLPTDMVVATPANATTDCNGVVSASLTATPGADFIRLLGGVVAAGSSCTVTVDVTATTTGVFVNRSKELSSGIPSRSSGFATAALEVPIDFLVKSFLDDPVPPGGTVTLQFTLTNLDRDEPATDVAFDDPLDPLGSLTGLAPSEALPKAACGGTVSFAAGTLSFTGGSLPAGGSCTFSVALDVPAMAPSGTFANVTGAITATVAGAPVIGNTATDNLIVSFAPILTKEFTDDPVGAGGVVTLQFKITNTSSDTTLEDIVFLDELTTFLPFPVSVSLPPSPNPPCGTGSALSLVDLPDPEKQALLLTGGTLAAGGTCTFEVAVTVPAGFAAGTYTNTTGVVTGLLGGMEPVEGLPASDDLAVIGGPSLLKEFTDDPAQPGGTVTLGFTLSHDDFAPGEATGITFTDDLSLTLPGLTATGLPQGDLCGPGNGTLTGSAMDTLLTFSGGTLQPGEVCTFSVTLQVPGTASAGALVNTTSSVVATVLGVTAAGIPASDDLVIAGLVLGKEFVGDPVLPGDTVTLRFNVENVSSISDATDITFEDLLDPSVLPGLTAAGPLPASPCGAGSTLAVFDPPDPLNPAAPPIVEGLRLTGGELLAGESCTFDVTLEVPAGTPSDTYANSTCCFPVLNERGRVVGSLASGFSAVVDGTTIFFDDATDDLVVAGDLLFFTKEFTDDPVAPGGTVTLEFTLTNLDAGQAASAIAFTDDLGAALPGLTFDGVLPGTCSGTVSGTGTEVISVSGVSLAAGASCTFLLSLSVPGGAAPGLYGNTTSGMTGTIGGLAVTGDPAIDELEVLPLLLFGKSFDGPTAATGTATLTFTLTNPGTAIATDVSFLDDLDAVIPGLVATSLPASPCGAASSITGTSVLTFTGGELPPMGGTCSFDVGVQVPATAAAGTFPNTTSELFEAGLKVADPATADLVIEPPPTFTKSFTPATAGAGVAVQLTLTIDNTASAVAASDLAFTDDLPAGVVVATPPNVASTCGGTPTAVAGTGTVSLSGGTVGAGASCTVEVDVAGMAAGTHDNTTGDLTSSSGNSGPASATLTVLPPPTFTKTFTPDTIDPGGKATLVFTIDNSASTLDATGIAFTDNLPAGMTVADPANASTDCTGGSLTAVPGTSVVSYAGGTVPAGSACTLQVDVTVDVMSGRFVNVTEVLSSSLGASGAATAALIVTPTVLEIPALSDRALVLLALLLSALAVRRLRAAGAC